jgi:hypothetical protein
MFCHGTIPKSLMRAISVVESYEFLVDVIEVAEAKAHEVIQAFSLDGADSCFRKRIGVRRPNRRSQSTDASTLGHAIESR